MTNWIISCNLKQYNIIGAFNDFDIIDWKQSANFEVGDVIYIYISHPVMEVRYKCVVIETNLSTRDQKDILYVAQQNTYENYGRYIRIRNLKTINLKISAKDLENNGLNGRIQGPRRLVGELLGFINVCEAKNEKHKFDNIDLILDNQLNVELAKNIAPFKNNYTYIPFPKSKQKPIQIQDKLVYPRDKQVALNALSRAKHRCEFNSGHSSFISKYTNYPYMEAHHLIPLAYQDQFEYSLDNESNIISLCSNCHNLIHYGTNQNEIIENLFTKRVSELVSSGLNIELKELLNLYIDKK